MLTEHLPCAICGFEGKDVAVALCQWRDIGKGPRYTAEPRCKDHEACRARKEQSGETWPLEERAA